MIHSLLQCSIMQPIDFSITQKLLCILLLVSKYLYDLQRKQKVHTCIIIHVHNVYVHLTRLTVRFPIYFIVGSHFVNEPDVLINRVFAGSEQWTLATRNNLALIQTLPCCTNGYYGNCWAEFGFQNGFL